MGEEEVQETGTEETPVAEVDNQGVEDSSESGLNPAWTPLLEKLPTSLHPLVTPQLSEWDKNFQSKLNEVHSQYAPYKNYLDKNVDPDQIDYALNIMQAIENRPVDVIKALTEYAKSQGLTIEEAAAEVAEQQGQVDESEIPSEFLNHPKWQQMEQTLQTVAQFLVQQKQTEQEQQQDEEIQAELASLKTEKGDFDEDWVITKAIQDANTGKKVTSLAPYVEQYFAHEKAILEKARKPGPKVLGSGGIAPDNQVDIKSLDDKGRRGMVQQMLAAAAQQSQ